MSKKKPAPTSGTSYRSVLSITALSSTGKPLRFLPAPHLRLQIAKKPAQNSFNLLVSSDYRQNKINTVQPTSRDWTVQHTQMDVPIEYTFPLDDYDSFHQDSIGWELKLHKQVCVSRSEARNLKSLKEVFRFRKIVGMFPDVEIHPGESAQQSYEKRYNTQFRKAISRLPANTP